VGEDSGSVDVSVGHFVVGGEQGPQQVRRLHGPPGWTLRTIDRPPPKSLLGGFSGRRWRVLRRRTPETLLGSTAPTTAPGPPATTRPPPGQHRIRAFLATAARCHHTPASSAMADRAAVAAPPPDRGRRTSRRRAPPYLHPAADAVPPPGRGRRTSGRPRSPYPRPGRGRRLTPDRPRSAAVPRDFVHQVRTCLPPCAPDPCFRGRKVRIWCTKCTAGVGPAPARRPARSNAVGTMAWGGCGA
jgi:hypothetical protein